MAFKKFTSCTKPAAPSDSQFKKFLFDSMFYQTTKVHNNIGFCVNGFITSSIAFFPMSLGRDSRLLRVKHAQIVHPLLICVP